MDYFQGVVTEYLRAKRTQFVNTEYMINLDTDGSYKKNRHWFCDAVAVDFSVSTVYLCEITYAKTLTAVTGRLQAWANHWADIVASIHKDSALPGDWQVVPHVFIPLSLRPLFDQKVSALRRPPEPSMQMPVPLVTPLEAILPWKYQSWTGKSYPNAGDA